MLGLCYTSAYQVQNLKTVVEGYSDTVNMAARTSKQHHGPCDTPAPYGPCTSHHGPCTAPHQHHTGSTSANTKSPLISCKHNWP